MVYECKDGKEGKKREYCRKENNAKEELIKVGLFRRVKEGRNRARL